MESFVLMGWIVLKAKKIQFTKNIKFYALLFAYSFRKLRHYSLGFVQIE